jgi:hypothetical protein
MSVSPDSAGLRNAPVQPGGGPLPLCVNLDGTVILSDLSRSYFLLNGIPVTCCGFCCGWSRVAQPSKRRLPRG